MVSLCVPYVTYILVPVCVCLDTGFCVYLCQLCILVLPSTQGHRCSGRNRNVTQCFEDVEKDQMRDREVGVNDGSNVTVPSGSCKV